MVRDCLQILVLLALAWLVYNRTAVDGPVGLHQAYRIMGQAADELPQARRTVARIWESFNDTGNNTPGRPAGLAPEITGGDIAAYLQGRPVRPAVHTAAAKLKNRKSS